MQTEDDRPVFQVIAVGNHMIEKCIDFVMIEGNGNDRPGAIFYIHFPDDKMIDDKELLF